MTVDASPHILNANQVAGYQRVVPATIYRLAQLAASGACARTPSIFGFLTYQTRLDPPPTHPWDEEYLGPELPKDQWWQDKGVGEWGSEGVVYTDQQGKHKPVKEPAAPYKESEPEEKEVLTLQPPKPPSPEKKKATPAPTPASTTVDIMPAPTGSRSTRLMRAMALGKDLSPLATRELVAFLADEDKSIRWLAGSSLVQRANLDVVSAIAAFLDKAEPERVDVARPEAERVLGLIANTAEDDAVRNIAKELLDAKP